MASVIQRSHVIPLKSCRVLLSFCCNPHHVGVLLSFCHSLFAYKIRNPSYRSCTLACQEKENSEKRKMEFSAKRGLSLSLALLLMMIMIQLKTRSCGASISSLNNINNSPTVTASLIADDLESEYLMDSGISRILGSQTKLSLESLRAGRGAASCGRVASPVSCFQENQNNIPKQDRCDKNSFQRCCSSININCH